MGIHGVFKEINSCSERISLAKFSSTHFATHSRPLILAIDIAIWLFQIQSGKGGSNPALRTFYYRLLRLLSLNIQPVFVFDGPNKPLWKRNKKVGGPGVRVASVPEFLAKQLLKQFGFPIHIAPGEAEAECAVLQQAGIVDAVMSEDVDTLMFGSEVLLRNWTPEGSSKTPTHVTVYRAAQTKSQTGLDGQSMVLVALMSGGDYVVEGIPGCGPKVACDAARAGFAKELCALAARKDHAGLQEWRERLQHEIRTNESKFFSRKNSTLVIPDNFPDLDILRYYTHPCVSKPAQLINFKKSLKWDQTIDFAALRTFVAEAFDWRCLGGAKKFIKNLAPAMLVRELRLRGEHQTDLEPDARMLFEKTLIQGIHGKRSHFTTDGELEYRISFLPAALVPIDLSIEEEDDPDSALVIDSDSEQDALGLSATTAPGPPQSPSKTRQFKPYYPDQPEKLWIMKGFLQIGSPLLIEDYEDDLSARLDKQKSKAKAQAEKAGRSGARAFKRSKTLSDMPRNAILSYTTITKATTLCGTNASSTAKAKTSATVYEARTEGSQNVAATTRNSNTRPPVVQDTHEPVTSDVSNSLFRFPRSRCLPMQDASRSQLASSGRLDKSAVVQPATDIADSELHVTERSTQHPLDPPRTPRRLKRVAPVSPSPGPLQKTIDAYWSPSSRARTNEVIDLLSSSPPRHDPYNPSTASLRGPCTAANFQEAQCEASTRSFDLEEQLCSDSSIPAGVTVRSRRGKHTPSRYCRGPLARANTAPTLGFDGDSDDNLSECEPARLPPNAALPASPSRGHSPGPPKPLEIDLTASSPLQPRISSHCADPMRALPSLGARSNSVSSSTLPQRTTPRESLTTEHGPAASAINKPQLKKKKRIVVRESLPGTFKEVEMDCVDLSGDGSGWKASGGRAELTGLRKDGHHAGWRASGIEILDLTGA